MNEFPTGCNDCKRYNLIQKAVIAGIIVLLHSSVLQAGAVSSIVTPDTGQFRCSDNSRFIACAEAEQRHFFGQDANYQGKQPSYKDNKDSTVTDLVTGLMWSTAVDETKVSLTEANDIAKKMRLGGYSDWRVPNIKELYSLMNFAGDTGSPEKMGRKGYPKDAVPFIDTDYFDFRYGNTVAGERYIDAQWLSATEYVSTTMDRMKTVFGVNFADGRIKGYGYQKKFGGPVVKKFYARYVRGPEYGKNEFTENGDSTVTDSATGLMWMKEDSKIAMTWSEALEYAESMEFAGYSDWRLPNAKELQYIVDYTRSPDTTDSPAIDPVFSSTPIINEADKKDYPFFWTSTTHYERGRPDKAAYIAFGRAIGQMRGQVMDVHGAGAQRSDPKIGNPRLGMGPQGDAQRIKNFVRLVRGGDVTRSASTKKQDKNGYPDKVRILENTSKTSSDPSSRFMQQRNRMQVPESRWQGQGNGQALFIKHEDKDGDNRVSKSEFKGPPEHFQEFDKNNDGYIEESEAPDGPPPGNRQGFSGPF